MKFKNTFFLLAVVIFTSCTVESDSEFTITKSDLVGTWNLTNFELNNATLVITNPPPTQTIVADAIGSNYNASITFSENPDITSVSGDFTLTVTYNQTNVDIYVLDSLLFNDIFGFTSSSWNYSNNMLTLMENGQNLEVEIFAFSNSIMEIMVDVNETVSINGITSNVTGKAKVTLEKI